MSKLSNQEFIEATIKLQTENTQYLVNIYNNSKKENTGAIVTIYKTKVQSTQSTDFDVEVYYTSETVNTPIYELLPNDLKERIKNNLPNLYVAHLYPENEFVTGHVIKGEFKRN